MGPKTRTTLLVLIACSSLLILTGPHPAKAQTLTPHAPIYITCAYVVNTCANTQDENFTSSDAVTSGSGTAVNPYIISDWLIVTNSTFGIRIRNTSSFFIIRNVLIQSTHFTGASVGIFLDNVLNGNVDSVNISNFNNGVSIVGGTTNVVQNSQIWNNTYAINMAGTYSKAIGNHLYNNTLYGVLVTKNFNTVTGNNASANGTCCGSNTQGAGIIVAANYNLFENNTLGDNTWFGIKLIPGSNNQILRNRVYRNGNVTGGGGIVLSDGSNRNLIMGNNVTKELNALGLEGGVNLPNTYNNITMNRVMENTQGIYLTTSDAYNTIYDNYLDNFVNALDFTSLNNWNTSKTLRTNILGGPFTGGNFYAGSTSGYSGSDVDEDGFGDTPYDVTGGPTQDMLPLFITQPSVVRDIAVQNVVAQTTARVGASISLVISVFNDGTIPESFNLSATYTPQTVPSPTIIRTVQVSLPAFSSRAETISWNTTGLGVGSYILQANASIVAGEIVTANNFCCASPAIVSLSINQLPVALFSVSKTSPLAGESVTLNAAQSYDPDGGISTYAWNFGDGTSPSNSIIVYHSWTLAGNYTVTLTVIDNEGGTVSNMKWVLVVYRMPSAPLNFQLTATTGNATLTWEVPSDIGGSPILQYRIYRGFSNSTYVWIANTTDTNYVDTTVAPGQTYYYKVTAVNQAGESPLSLSAPQSVLIPMTPPQDSSSNLLTMLAIAGGLALAVTAGIFVVRRTTRPKSKAI